MLRAQDWLSDLIMPLSLWSWTELCKYCYPGLYLTSKTQLSGSDGSAISQMSKQRPVVCELRV